MVIKVTENTINDKIKRGEEIIGTKVIKYPSFECEKGMAGEKLCKKMNAFYKDIAEKFSTFSDRKLPRRPGQGGGKIKVGMKYMISVSNRKVICVVIDLMFYDGRGATKRRFSQIWDTRRGDMVPVGEILKTDLISRKKIFSLVLSAAEKKDKSGGGYFDGVLSELKRHFSIFNCFLLSDGVCFFIDAGRISPSGLGAECFKVSKKDLTGMFKGDYLDTDGEDCK